MARKCVEGCTCGKHPGQTAKTPYYLANKEKILAQSKASYQKNREKILGDLHLDYQNRKEEYSRSARQSYLRHRDKALERGKRYYAANKEKARVGMREWVAKNPEKPRAIQRKYQALKRGAVTSEQVDYGLILERDGLVCYLCGKSVELKEIHFDHVIPLSRGGSHSYENLKVTHGKCNQWKHNRLVQELPLPREVIIENG